MTTMTTTTAMSKTRTEPTQRTKIREWMNERTRCETHLTQTFSGSEIIICVKVRARYILLHITARKNTNRGNTMPYWSFYFMFWIWLLLRMPFGPSVGLAIWTLTLSHSHSHFLFTPMPCFVSLFIHLFGSIFELCSSCSPFGLCSPVFNGVSHLTDADLCWYRWSFVAIRYGI